MVETSLEFQIEVTIQIPVLQVNTAAALPASKGDDDEDAKPSAAAGKAAAPSVRGCAALLLSLASNLSLCALA
jgi:hypothetical protein